MITYYHLVALLVVHWFADFFLQSDEMARKKSKDIGWLTYHCLVYAMWFIVFGDPVFVVLMFISHWLVDFVTSKINAKLWAKNQVHWFFVSVGFDQLLHICITLWLWEQYMVGIHHGGS